jgi:hypothetical protein
MGGLHGQHAKTTFKHITPQTLARQLELVRSDITAADLATERRMEFDKGEAGDVVAGIGSMNSPDNVGRARLFVVIFH